MAPPPSLLTQDRDGETGIAMVTSTDKAAGPDADAVDPCAMLCLSELVERSGIPPSTIHHYLSRGLIPPPTRTALNRNRYDERHVTALRLIRILRERRGLSLDEIAVQLPGLLARADLRARLDEADAEDDTDVTRRLTDAAIEAFQTRSFGEVTVSDIAEAAGVAKGSVYRYFGSKEDVFTAAVERVLADTATEFGETVRRLGGAEGVARVPERTAGEFAAVVAQAMPMLLELGARAAKGNEASELLARRVLRTLAEATGRPLVTECGGEPIAAGLAVIKTAFAVMLDWAVGTEWPPDDTAGPTTADTQPADEQPAEDQPAGSTTSATAKPS